MLGTRIITAIVGIPFIIGIMYLGGVYWQGFIALLGATALYEYFAMMASKGYRPLIVPSYIISGILLFREQIPHFPEVFLAGLLLIVLVLVTNYSRFGFDDMIFSFFGAFYIGYLLSYALAFAGLDRFFVYILLVFILTWASDVGGYLFGKLWGQHKLAPQLSPGKTWEGAAGAILLTVVLALLVNMIIPINMSFYYLILMGVLASITAQVGDLLESAMKRYFAVKDSGHIIPGHGGVLDRFDSFLLLLPVLYYFLVVLA